jgi:conserved oligomeric Golgi complex subunit 3
MEHQLHEHFFPGDAPPSSGDAGGLEALTEPLCTALYDALRPRFILLQRLDDLCELVDILKHEVRGAPAAVPSRISQRERSAKHC